MPKSVSIKNNVFKMGSGTNEHPLDIETEDEDGNFSVAGVDFKIEGCEIHQVDGRWPISFRQGKNGRLRIELVNVKIIAMGEPAKREIS